MGLKTGRFRGRKVLSRHLNYPRRSENVYSDVYYHEMQMWANRGYFVFFCNPRGSDGRGTDFGNINGIYGTVDYQNLMDFTDEVLRRYPMIDPEHLGVAGGSYGGFMTNWIIGHTDRSMPPLPSVPSLTGYPLSTTPISDTPSS